MEKQKHYSPQEKVKILLEYFEEQPSISSLCQKYNIHPNSFYQWKKELFENAD
jgi:transposase-like protein